MQRGEGEGGGLAGAGLRDAEQVAAFQQGRDGLPLDRRGVVIAARFECAQDRLGQAELGKIGHVLLFRHVVHRGRNPGAKRGLFGDPGVKRVALEIWTVKPVPVLALLEMGRLTLASGLRDVFAPVAGADREISQESKEITPMRRHSRELLPSSRFAIGKETDLRMGL